MKMAKKQRKKTRGGIKERETTSWWDLSFNVSQSSV